MFRWNSIAAPGGAFALAAALIAPAPASAEMYAWRTEDGVFAYADDRDKIPARYATQAVRVGSGRFGSYERLTVEDSASTSAVNERLRSRLEYLRDFNRAPATPAAAPVASRASTISIATGSPQAPTLDIAADDAAGPVVVETVLGKESTGLLTRSTTVVTQGDRTLAVLKGRRNQHNLSTDILDLDEVGR